MNRMKWAGIALAVLLMAGEGRSATYRRPLERVMGLDPATTTAVPSSRAVALAYETLVQYDYEVRPYRLIPGVSALPEISEGGKVYTFRLRKNARFHPDPCFGFDEEGNPRGRPVYASDFVFAFKRLADRKLASSGTWMVEGILGIQAFSDASAGLDPTDYGMEVPGLRALDDYTLRIELTTPFSQFAWYLTLPYMSAIAHEAVAVYGKELARKTVGSGPYRLTSWKRNYEMVYERVPEWWGWHEGPMAFAPDATEKPFDRIVYSVVDDASTQWLMFLKGEVDFLGEISRDNWDVVIDPKKGLSEDLIKRGITLHSAPTLKTYFIGLNMEDPVLGPNQKLRQALNCAFDFDRWYDFYNGRIRRLTTIAPPHIKGALPDPFPYSFDLERARALLAEAGYPGGVDPATGRRLVLTIDLGRSTQDARESAELLASFFAKIGIDLRMEFNNWPAFLKKLNERKAQMFSIGWVGDYPDIETFVQPFLSRNCSPGPNRINLVNPEIDRLYTEAVSSTDEAVQLAAWEKIQRIIREDVPWIFTHYTIEYSLVQKRVLNYIPHDFPYGMEKYLKCREEGSRE